MTVSTLERIGAAGAAMDNRKLPPVHRWNPEFSGDIAIRIARDGTWYHAGDPIGRDTLVRLFSTLLKREGDDYFLVTPAEKWRIRVDDAPFVVNAMTRDIQNGRQVLILVTRTDDRVVVGAEHPLEVRSDPSTGEPAPYVLVRDHLHALISRNVFYELAALAEEPAHGSAPVYGVTSGGIFFPLM